MVRSLRIAVVPLRVLLASTFLALVVAQVMSFPGMFEYQAERSESFAQVRWPLLAVFELGMLSVQAVIVCTWRLLTLVVEDRVFTPAALRWVDAILGAIAVAWVLLVGLFVAVLARADDPGDPFAMFLIVLPATAFALVMVVMRALLVQATTLRADMEAVI